MFFCWTYWRLLETKDKTFEELDILFAHSIKASKFDSYRVDAHVNGHEGVLRERNKFTKGP